jgi:hypothetical protein
VFLDSRVSGRKPPADRSFYLSHAGLKLNNERTHATKLLSRHRTGGSLREGLIKFDVSAMPPAKCKGKEKLAIEQLLNFCAAETPKLTTSVHE